MRYSYAVFGSALFDHHSEVVRVPDVTVITSSSNPHVLGLLIITVENSVWINPEVATGNTELTRY